MVNLTCPRSNAQFLYCEHSAGETGGAGGAMAPPLFAEPKAHILNMSISLVFIFIKFQFEDILKCFTCVHGVFEEQRIL